MAVKELLGQLHEVAECPRKQLERYLGEGRKVIAMAPVYGPQEIVHSMGLVPWAYGARMWKSMRRRNITLHLFVPLCRQSWNWGLRESTRAFLQL